MPYLRTILAVSFLMLLLSCGGREAAPQPAAAPPDSTIPEPQLQSLEEKYPGYEIKRIRTEYMYESDANAPIIYTRVDTIISEVNSRVQIATSEIRESRSTMDSLPENIQDFMRQNGIVIPGFKTSVGNNHIYENLFLKGNLGEGKKSDWVVMSATSDSCWLSVFWDGGTDNITSLNCKSMEHSFRYGWTPRSIFLTDNQANSSIFSYIGIFTCTVESYEYYKWPNSPQRPTKFSHDGLAEFDPMQGGYYYRYFDGDNWLTWGDAVSGWEEWHEVNGKTLQEEMLKDATECREIPKTLADRWSSAGRKIVQLPDNQWWIEGEFIKEGSSDLLLITTKEDDNTSVALTAILLSAQDSCISIEDFSVEQFKKMVFDKVSNGYSQEKIEHYREAAKDSTSYVYSMYTDHGENVDNFIPALTLDLDCLEFSYYNPVNPDEDYGGLIYFQNGSFRCVKLPNNYD